MSRLGKKAIPLPKNVEVKLDKDVLSVKGPKGIVTRNLEEGVGVTQESNQIFVTSNDDSREGKALHGLYWALIRNMVMGVTEGFVRKLSLVGVGYRAAVQGKALDLQLGFSHPTKVEIPSSLKVEVEKNTTIIISGMDKQVVGQFAANVRGIRPPEPYKGKGIRYEDEVVRKKAGKASKGK